MTRGRATRPTSLAATIIIVLLTVAVWWLQERGDDARPTAAPASPTSSSTSALPSGGLPVVDLADLPPEATHVVDLIDDGGPYPYPQDDGTFGNYEGRLPDEPRGYYREYTVETPGAPTRGARRIIAGADGTLYWTADHYASFAVIER